MLEKFNYNQPQNLQKFEKKSLINVKNQLQLIKEETKLKLIQGFKNSRNNASAALFKNIVSFTGIYSLSNKSQMWSPLCHMQNKQLVYLQGGEDQSQRNNSTDQQQKSNADYSGTFRAEETQVMTGSLKGDIFNGNYQQYQQNQQQQQQQSEQSVPNNQNDDAEDPNQNYNRKVFHRESELPESTTSKEVKVLLPIHNGYEEIETATIVDILTRAGAYVVVASCNPTAPLSELVKGAYGTQMLAHFNIQDCQNYEFDLIVLPGGMENSEGLAKNEVLTEMLQAQKQNDRWYASICASPAVVFERNGLLVGEKATAYPSLASQLTDQSEVAQEVVVSNKCITSQGPATAAKFSFTLVEKLFGHEKVQQIKSDMLYDK